MIKPQILVLILPGLLIGRRWPALGGFGVGAVALAVASFGLAGVQGMVDLMRLLTFEAAGPASAAPQHMVNWRSLAVNLEPLLPPALAWGLAAAGMLVTAGVALALWRRPIAASPERLALVWTATFAATCAATWHSHQHMAMPVIVLLLYLALKGILPTRHLFAWLLAPMLIGAAVMLAVGAAFIWAGGATLDLGLRIGGLSILAANVWVLFWARRALMAPFERHAKSP